MLNQIMLIGRLTAKPEVSETKNGKRVANIRLAVPRDYKNSDGERETDFIDCTFWQGVAQNIADYCQKGDLVAIKGKLQTNNYEDKEGKKVYKMFVNADKCTFLSASKFKEDITKGDESLEM